MLGEFITMKSKIKMKCNIHNEVFYKEPDKVLNRSQHCRKCGRERIAKSRRLDNDEFEVKFYKHRESKEFQLLSDYRGDRESIWILHKVCGERFCTTPSSVWNSKGCPLCNDVRKTTDQFIVEVKQLVGEEYTVLGQYSNCYTHIRMKHNDCGHEWELMPNSFLQGSRCPKCKSSKGEGRVSNYLSLHCEYATQYKIEDCRLQLPLPFDFYIPDSILIEYDGEQHFTVINNFGRESPLKEFEKQVRRDSIKNQYCVNNDIPLIRIPYWEFDNIEYILDNVLKYFNIIDGECRDTSIVKKYYVREGWDHNQYIKMSKQVV